MRIKHFSPWTIFVVCLFQLLSFNLNAKEAAGGATATTAAAGGVATSTIVAGVVIGGLAIAAMSNSSGTSVPDEPDPGQPGCTGDQILVGGVCTDPDDPATTVTVTNTVTTPVTTTQF